MLKKSGTLRATSEAGKVREAAVLSFLHAWRTACTPINCMTAARKTGIYPFNVRAAEESIFVRDLTADEQRRFDAREARNAHRININGTILTDAQLIVSLANRIRVPPTKFGHLCDLQSTMTKRYSQIVNEVLSSPKNQTLLLSRVPPYLSESASPLRFDK